MEARIVDIDKRLEERFAPVGVGEIALVRDRRMSARLHFSLGSPSMNIQAYHLDRHLDHQACLHAMCLLD